MSPNPRAFGSSKSNNLLFTCNSTLPLSLRLGLCWGKGSGLDFGLEVHLAVAAIAEGFILRVSAAAKADGGAPAELESIAFHVTKDELPFDPQRSVVFHGYLRQVFLPIL